MLIKVNLRINLVDTFLPISLNRCSPKKAIVPANTKPEDITLRFCKVGEKN